MGYRDMFVAGRRILGLLEERRGPYVVAIAAGVLSGAFTWLVPLLVREVFVALEGGSPTVGIETALWALVAVQLVRGALRHANVYLTSVIGYDVSRRARVRLYGKLSDQSLGFLGRAQTGALMSRAVGDCDTFEMFLYRVVPVAAIAMTVPLGMGVVLLALDWRLGLLAAIFAPLSTFVLLRFSSEVRIRYMAHRNRHAEISAMFHEALSALPVIKSFNREREQLARIRAKAEQYRDSVLWVLRVGAFPISIAEGLVALAVAALAYGGALEVLGARLDLADFFVFLLYSLYFYEPLRELNQVSGRFQNAVNGAQRVFSLLDAPPDVLDAADASVPARPSWDIAFERVSFAYEPSREALRDVSFRIGEGEVVALVGQSGSGKTTVAHLVSRFYDPGAGRVLVGGRDIRSLPQAFLHESVSMVMQDVFLFDDTVRENIRLARPKASDDDVVGAARAANLHDAIVALAGGYEARVGERAARLSGGEKQRLSVARALLKDAPILLLDEATSSVDAESEALIQEALGRLTRGRTVLVIAHRLATVRGADRILVLDAGRIVEEGSHDELLAIGGRYSAAFAAQRRTREWRIAGEGA